MLEQNVLCCMGHAIKNVLKLLAVYSNLFVICKYRPLHHSGHFDLYIYCLYDSDQEICSLKVPHRNRYKYLHGYFCFRYFYK